MTDTELEDRDAPTRTMPVALVALIVVVVVGPEGGITDGEVMVRMLGDFADLWDRSAVDGTPVREIVGDDPVGFAEEFAQAYGGTRWIDKERARLTEAVNRATGDPS